MLDLDTLWGDIKDGFRSEVAPTAYTTWIDTADPIKLTNHRLTIKLPSELHRDYWKRNLTQPLVEFAYEATHEDIQPVFVVEDEATNATVPREPATNAHSVSQDAKLNPKYTFDTFVIGKGNQMAHAAALVVSEEPGSMYNPLFFYGGVGLGKTHLMHAIGNKMLKDDPNTKVKYVTSEAFTNDFITAIQSKTQEQFREEYRNVDLLLVDDIQFFADKEGTQEEFFHTFNALYDDGKQIVLTSDRLPHEIPKLQDRLVSRFAWGLSVDITPPDLETRIAILRNKATADEIDIPDETLSYIASHIDSNVRELEGALSRVHAYSKLMHQPISTELVATSLKSLKLDKHSSEVTIPSIQEKVAKYYHVSLADLKGKKRMKSIVMPRQIAMYLSRELTDSSLPKIGNEFGGKDHTTVIHAYDKIAEALKTDSDLQSEISNLKTEIDR
ncbi:chromosomal replication initiator protein DnaA [Secundilactobacillus collinoides]|uniref:Chromosomal replication initiator protein DnaA n=1 Tax=Secundilactobacillus collinoides DSM 20515 = JCM 1123 TaxID=1423733 RepID=A0A0R2B9E0_SECCO|nr:chromosomal replication initiator protein DnaA [Secundilactobacillus collinoides]KRM75857.1 chromosomal replication initiation protein [Secundilactobacillus collinoides DSM 20515 = JCM 1123]